MSNIRYFFLFPFFSLFFINSSVADSQKEITIPGSSDADISVEIFEPQNKHDGEFLIVWLAPEYGFQPNHHNMAELLVRQNIEVWQSDIAESLFLPQGSTSLKQLNGNYVADIIEYAHKMTGKKIVVAGDSYAAVNALTGAHEWQSRYLGSSYLIGAILFSPNSYAYIPPLGLDPEYMPVMDSTNIPLVIYQAKNNGNIGQFKTVLRKLQQHNNPVYTKILPDVISLFHNKTPTNMAQKTSLSLASNIKKILPILARYSVPLAPIPLFKNTKSKTGIDIYLKSFKGNNKPLNINLIDAYDNQYIKNDFTKRVTIINFWATWCPPCVEEIPSLNRLNKTMHGLPFDLISINYAEDKQTILNFLEKVNVDYPVLLDQDGNYAKQWNVITYPSTFIIDTEGKIAYGVNAAIDWDDPQIIKIIKSLF